MKAVSDKNEYQLRLLVFLILGCNLFVSAVFSLVQSSGAISASLTENLIVISAYYLCALPLTVALRRRYNSVSLCDLLLLPVLLCWINSKKIYAAIKPILIPAFNARWITFFWLSGAAVCFLFFVIRHLLFRNNILKNRLENPPCIEIALSDYCENNSALSNARLVSSSFISSPMLVGIMPSQVLLALPAYEYSEDDLKMIFAHETLHYLRRDNIRKLFGTMLCSMFWFNPLSWIAFYECSCEIEMACDEQVLASGGFDRASYAHIIISTSNLTSGFSSRLAAGHKSIKLRIRNIMSEKAKRSAIVFIIIAIILCGIGRSFVLTVNPERSTISDVFGEGVGISKDQAAFYTSPLDQHFSKCEDPSGLDRYLQGLEYYEACGLPQIDSLTCLSFSLGSLNEIGASIYDCYIVMSDAAGTSMVYYAEGLDLDDVRAYFSEN